MEISFNDYVEKLEGIYGNNLGLVLANHNRFKVILA